MALLEVRFELGCRNCKTLRGNSLMYFKTERPIDYYTRDRLILAMDSFDDIECNNCGTIGNWVCFKIFIDGHNPIVDQFKLNVFKREGKLFGKPEDGSFSRAQIYLALDLIKKRALENSRLTENSTSYDGVGVFVVDFLNDEPYSRLAVYEIEGISDQEVIMITEAIEY